MLDTLLGIIVAHWAAILIAGAALALVFSHSARTAGLATLRIVARPLLLVAMVALIYDGTRALAGSSIVTTSLAEHWQTLAPASFEGLKAVIGRRLHPALWDPALLKILNLPAWLVLGGLGLAFSYIGRKRRGVDVFAN